MEKEYELTKSINRAIAKATLDTIGVIFLPTGKKVLAVSEKYLEQYAQQVRKETFTEVELEVLSRSLEFMIDNAYTPYIGAVKESDSLLDKLRQLQKEQLQSRKLKSKEK